MKRTLGALAAAAGLFLAVGPAAHGQDRPTLLTGMPSASQADVRPAFPKPGLVRARPIVLNASVLEKVRSALQRNPGVPVEISVPAFDDTALVVSIARVQQTGHGTVEFLGTVKGDDLGSAALVVSHGLVAGTIHTNNHAYQIAATGGGGYQVLDLDRSRIRDEAGPVPEPHPLVAKAIAEQAVPAVQMDDGSTIDLLVVYTTAAKQQANGNTSGSAQILAQIDLAVATTNQAYANSGVVQRIRLVGTQEEVGYNEVAGDLSVDLGRLSNKNPTTGVAIAPDGFLDDVQALRDATGADVVSLWVKDDAASNIAGLGWLMSTVGAGFESYAYNVVVWDTASSNLTLPHEMGHNMGLRHDAFVDSDTSTPFPYAHGYVDLAHRFRTVMAYDDACQSATPATSCVRVTGFSSPLATFDGAPQGLAATADSARVLNTTRTTVANFRASVAGGGTLAFRDTTIDTNEGAGNVLVPVARLGGTSGAASVSWSTTAVNAVDGVDFTSSSGTLNWADGDGADKNISVPILQDSVADGEKIFTVALSGAAGAVITTNGSVATVKIADDEPDAFPVSCANPSGWSTPPGVAVGWFAAHGAATEGSCSFKAHNVGPPASCAVPLAFNSAQSQFTGTFLAGNITFDARVSSYPDFGCLQLTIDGGAASLGGTCANASEVLALPGLTPTPSPNTDTGWQHISIPVTAGTHTLKLIYQIPCVTDGDNTAYVDNLVMPIDPATVPTLNFSQPAYTVVESGPTISVQVTRTGPSTGAIGVTWATSNGAAIAGQDFGTSGNATQKTGTLAWAAGDAAAKTITVGPGGTIPVINDSLIESSEDFSITLSAPTGGAALGAQSSTTVNITDDDSTFDFDTAATSVGEAGPNIVLNVTRTGSLNTTATVTYTTSNGAAMVGTDFGTAGSLVQPTGTLSFGPGISSRSITIGPVAAAAPFIPVINDTAIEGPKAFNVTLSAPAGGGHLGTTTTAAVTIVSDDSGIAMDASARSVAEAAGTLQVQVDRLGSAAGPASVNYAFTNSTATNGTHFSGTAGTLSWIAGDSSPKFIPVGIIDNSVVNSSRTFTVTLSSPTGAVIGSPASTVVTITDDDNTLQFSAATASVGEGAGLVNLTVTRLGGAANAASVAWSAADGSAQAGADYGTLGNSTPPSGVLNWGAGDAASKVISIPILQDALIEGPEAFTVTLSSPSGTGAAVGSLATATVTIVDDDSGVSFNALSYNVIESGPMVTVQVNRIGVTTNAIGVTWTTSNGTAIAGQRYGTLNSPAQRTGTLSWLAGDATPKTISVGPGGLVPTLNNTVIEPTQNFTITLSAPTGGAALGPQPATTVNILDDDSVFAFDAPTLSVNEAGPNVTLNVTRTGSLNTAANVTFSTTAGTAAAVTRFTATTGTLTFAAGESVKPITIGSVAAPAPHIPVVNDAIIQGPQTFSVGLSSPTGGGQLGSPATSTITIVSDDRGIAMGASTRSVAENAGAIDIQVARLGPATGTAVSVNYAFTNGTAINGTHYTGTAGQLNWADGDATAKTIHVPIIDDSAVNANRTFTVTLSGALNASLGTPASTVVTILDDDNTLQFSAPTASVTEGAALMLTVTRIGGTAGAASVQWSTANGTAVAGTDFGAAGVTAPVSGVLSWNAGELTAKTLSIPVINDTSPEGARTFTVSLSSPTGANVGTVSTVNVTLNDNDAGFLFSSPTYTVVENGGNVTLTVMRVGPATAAGTVGWATANGTALAGSDFGTSGSSAQRSGTLSWAAGDATVKTIVIPIINDAIAEADETFTVQLRTPSTGFALGSPNVATVTILDDDIPPESELAFSLPKYLVLESAGSVLLTVNRNDIGGGFGRAATVSYATVAGTALASSDFMTRTGTLTWASGDSAPKNIAVPIVNDSIAESPETFKVTLSNVTPGTRIATPSATVLIVDDDEVFPPQGAFPANWVTPAAATAGWSVSNDPGAFEGVFTLKSEAIADNQTAQTSLTGTFVAGTVSFRVRVSSEQDFDLMRFYVDGVLQPAAQWSGTATSATWQLYSVPLTAGLHTLTWSYEKDGSASLGQDAAWIDAVTTPAYTP